MAHKVINITDWPNKYDLLTQTPDNYNIDNYYLKELQEKVLADWRYRPNRVQIEYEDDWGQQTYSPIEVVVQSVKTDKGEAISNDCRRIVFKNIREDRFSIGNRFRFSEDYKIDDPEVKKNVWFVTNYNQVSMTSSVVIERCNGNIGSVYVDGQGVTHYHYEPVIQGRDLESTNFRYSNPIVAPQSQLTIICQHNDFTKNYYINQRFIIGYDHDFNNETENGNGTVYRITAINKFYSRTTFDNTDVGLMKIYLEITESSFYDNFKTGIAYQTAPEVYLDNQGEKNYSIRFKEPSFIPPDLPTEKLLFKPVVVLNNALELEEVIPIEVELSLERLPRGIDIGNYVGLEIDSSDYSFKLYKKRPYLNGDLTVTCKVSAQNSPTGEEFKTSFKLVTRGK